MKNWEKITGLFILIMVVVIAIYDGIAIFQGGREGSISHWLIIKSYDFPIIPFIAGFICGHLFWRMRDTKDTQRISKQ